MGKNSKIEWTDHTWNPWIGCMKVSKGCKNCYAETWAKQYGWTFRDVVKSKTKFDFPLKLELEHPQENKVFTCSLSDFFIKQADALRPEVWEIIRARPDLIFQILTKRPERILQCLPPDWGGGYPNVWLGTSVESTEEKFRIPQLLQVPAALHWVSMEPLLEPVSLIEFLGKRTQRCGCGWLQTNRKATPRRAGWYCTRCDERIREYPALDWVVTGGESGPRRREFQAEWARALWEECWSTGTPFFMTQMDKVWEIPSDLEIWEFPKVA